jgi:hypothetical protein
MDAHGSSVVRATSFHLRNIGIVRKQLTNDATKLLVQSMVLSRLDYCNSCLKGVSEASLDRLKLVQNCAARLVMRTKRWQDITPTLMEIHWLPIRKRIDYYANNGLFSRPIWIFDGRRKVISDD